MSGPKGGGYSVESAASREARELAAALARYEQTRLEMERLRGDAKAARAVLGRAVMVPAALPRAGRAGRNSTAVAAADISARETVRAARDELASATRRLGQERWEARFGPTAAAGDLRLAPAAAAPTATAAPDPWRAAALEQLAAIAAGWPPGEPSTVLDDATDALARARSSSSATVQVSRARDELARLRAHRRAEDAVRAELDRLRADVESVRDLHDSGVAAALLADIDSAGAGQAPILAGRVERFVAEAHARRDRDEATAILADVLTELGYRLGEGFTTRLSDDADVLVGHERWTEHAVSVQLDVSGRIRTHLVRSSDAASDDDAHADAAFCADFDTIRARSAGRGLTMHSVRRYPPGERAVRTVEPGRVRAVAPSRSSSGSPVRERNR